MTNFRRMTAKEYRSTISHKMVIMMMPYKTLCDFLGEPHKNMDYDFPDAIDCVDVCWGVISTENPKNEIMIWNYKTSDYQIQGFNSLKETNNFLNFSVYYSDKKFFDEIHDSLCKLALKKEETLLEKMSKEDLIDVIATMQDAVQNWENGCSCCSQEEAAKLKEIGNECLKYNLEKQSGRK